MALLGAVRTVAGKSITPQTAMGCPAVSAAVAIIRDPIATFSFHVYERGSNGERKKAVDHPAYRLVHSDASEFVSAGALRAQLIQDALLKDFGIAIVNRVNGRPYELIALRPESVTITQDDHSGDLVFTLNEKGGPRVLDRRDVVYLPAASIDGVRPIAPIKVCREAIALALVLEECKTRLFSHGAQPALLLSPKSPNPTEGATALSLKVFKQQVEGIRNYGGAAVMPEAFEVTKLGMSNIDAQLQELSAAQIREIGRALNVPPTYLGDLSGAKFSNYESESRRLLQFTLQPWIEKLQAALRQALIPFDERDRFYIEADTNALLKADLLQRAQAYALMIQSRVLSPNEARESENRQRVEGQGMDDFQNPNVMSGAAAPTTSRQEDEDEE